MASSFKARAAGAAGCADQRSRAAHCPGVAGWSAPSSAGAGRPRSSSRFRLHGLGGVRRVRVALSWINHGSADMPPTQVSHNMVKQGVGPG